jgi:bacterioferritin-associated ferredoxin
MIVCVCASVSERKLRAVIADGATTMTEIERRCGAGAACGACRSAVRECLRECRLAAAYVSHVSHVSVEAPQASVEFAADAPELVTA